MNLFRSLSIGTRILALGIVATSPWLKPVSRPNNTQSIVYVVDASASVGADGLLTSNEYIHDAWKNHHREHIGVVAFGGRAELIAPVGAGYIPDVGPSSDPGASDLAGAIRLATASLPAEGHRSIVVLSDFRPTRGDAEGAVKNANAAGIRVDVVPLDSVKPSGPMITAFKPRAAHVSEHQPVSFDVEVSVVGPYVIEWTRDGIPMPQERQYSRRYDEDATTNPSKASVTLTDPDPPPGVHVYEAHASQFAGYAWGRGASKPSEDEKAPSALTAVTVEGKPYAAVFSASGDVPAVLSAALNEMGLEAHRLPVDRAADPSAYTGADLVVLSDVRVTAAEKDDTGLTHAAQLALLDYVQQGGGLLTTGGVFGLAPEYANTPIARAIPVDIEDRGHVEDPPVTLAIMLDRSGSMAMQVGSHTKLDLALEASLGAAEVLRPTDFVALASVDTETHWDIPLGPQARLPEYREAVRQVGAGGGGIYVYTALKDAYAALKDSHTPIRHVILFSDTADSEQQGEDCGGYEGTCHGKTAEKLAKEARAKGITTTVVGIGEEGASDTPFLRRLAAAAGGRFYITSEGTDLRRIFMSETRVLAQSNLRERKTNVLATGAHPALEGVNVGKLPSLAAYVETGRRAGADTALVMPDGRPFLATWRYGLGKSGAIATDFSEGWGGEWGSSSNAAQLLRQSLRFLLRQSDAKKADASVTTKDTEIEMDIQLPPDAPASSAPTALDVYAVEKSGTSHKVEMRLEQRGPGHWVARGRSNGEPVVIARARDSRGALMAEALGREDRAPEITGDGVDAYFAGTLARVGDGRVEPTPMESLQPTATPAKALVATWPYALVAASLLVVLDLIFRRISERVKTKAGAPARIDHVEAPAVRAAA